MRETLFKHNSLEVAESYYCLGLYYKHFKKYTQAQEYFEESYSILNVCAVGDFPRYSYFMIDALYSLGEIHRFKNNVSQMESLQKKESYLRELLIDSNPYSRETTLVWTGKIIYQIFKDFQKAIYYCMESARSCLTKEKEHIHVNVIRSLIYISLCYFELEKYDKAIEYRLYLNDILIKLDCYEYDLAESFNQTGLIYLKLTNYSKAIEFFNKSYEMNYKMFENKQIDEYELIKVLRNICKTYELIGENNDQFKETANNLEKNLKPKTLNYENPQSILKIIVFRNEKHAFPMIAEKLRNIIDQ